jgi:hypothetical protein
MKNKKENKSEVRILNFSNYSRPEIVETSGRQWVKYGLNDDNVPSYEEQGVVRTQENGNTYMFILKDEVDVDGLVDHLERPLTNINVSVLHRNNMKMFNQQQYGFERQFGYGNEDALTKVEESLYDGNNKVVKDLSVGDTIMGGRFKNKKVIVKKIGKNKKGDITINDKPLLKFRIIKESITQ